MSHRQYFLECQDAEMELEDYLDLPYPHPYLTMWLECKRYPLPTGAPALPEPDKGPLDQDADVMLAFEVLEEAHMQQQQEEEARHKNRAAAAHMQFSLNTDEEE